MIGDPFGINQIVPEIAAELTTSEKRRGTSVDAVRVASIKDPPRPFERHCRDRRNSRTTVCHSGWLCQRILTHPPQRVRAVRVAALTTRMLPTSPLVPRV